MLPPQLTPAMVSDFQRDGAVLIKGFFDADHVEALRAGVDRVRHNPGPFASENTRPGDSGRFWDDYCNWARIPEFSAVVYNSPAAAVGAALMRSRR